MCDLSWTKEKNEKKNMKRCIHKMPKGLLIHFLVTNQYHMKIWFHKEPLTINCNLTRSHCGEKDLKGYLGKDLPLTLLFYCTLSKSDNKFKIIYYFGFFFTFIFQKWTIILDIKAQFIAQVFFEIKLWQTGNGSADQTSW